MSLLWPDGAAHGATLAPAAAADLAIDRIARALDIDGQHARVIRPILAELCAEPSTISYRQAILADLLAAPDLARSLRSLLPDLQALGTGASSNWPGDSLLHPVLTRLRELDRYVSCVDRLHEVLGVTIEPQSAGLRALRGAIATLAADPNICALRDEIPEMHELIGEAKSVTIGLNLDADLEPESAAIVELNHFQFRGGRTLLGRLMPAPGNGAPPTVGPLHHAGPRPLRRESELFRDLQRLLESVAAPLVKALGRYREVNVGPLAALERELAFLLGAAALAERLRSAGIALCRPEIAAGMERSFSIRGLRNLSLALQMLDDAPSDLRDRLVANDAHFDNGMTILILTGPNRGGKTTFCRALGQAQVLFQAGLFVPADAARLSPVDGIWTHFPLPETDRPGAGRLDEEAQRLRQIFDHATGQSLLLLNEPLTSTSERDALIIATDLVRALRILGAHTLLVTHLHDLARSIPQLNEAATGAKIGSLVAEATRAGAETRGTFRILPGLPTGRSYAAEIARQHGLTFEQLAAFLSERSNEPA